MADILKEGTMVALILDDLEVAYLMEILSTTSPELWDTEGRGSDPVWAVLHAHCKPKAFEHTRAIWNPNTRMLEVSFDDTYKPGGG